MAKERKIDTYAEFQKRRNIYAGLDTDLENNLENEILRQNMSILSGMAAASIAQSKEQQGRDSGNSNSSRGSK